MKISMCFFFLGLLSLEARAQNYDARISSLLAEVDASDLEFKTARLASEIAATLKSSGVTSAAILPFREAQNRRTGLTDFVATQLGKKLMLTPKLEIMPAEQSASLLRNQIEPATMRWPQEVAAVAARLGVASLVRGRVIDNAVEIALIVEIYNADKAKIIGTHRTNLPRTEGLSRLLELVVDETSSEPPTPPTEKPQDEPALAPTLMTPTVQTALEASIRSLANKLMTRLMETKPRWVGVMEFLDLQGRISQLGKFVGEELTTVFFEKGKFAMVERNLLQQTMREQALAQSGIIEATKAQEIGMIVGAEAIITGTLSDIGNEIKVNARLIDVRTGAVLAVAGESIAKTENVARLFNTILWSKN